MWNREMRNPLFDADNYYYRGIPVLVSHFFENASQADPYLSLADWRKQNKRTEIGKGSPLSEDVLDEADSMLR